MYTKRETNLHVEIHFKETLIVLAFTFSALSPRSCPRYTSLNLPLNSPFLYPYEFFGDSANMLLKESRLDSENGSRG